MPVSKQHHCALSRPSRYLGLFELYSCLVVIFCLTQNITSWLRQEFEFTDPSFLLAAIPDMCADAYSPIESTMDPSIVPGRPVADHEVSASMPLEANHRRHRHPPLLHPIGELMPIYGKPSNRYCSLLTSQSAPDLTIVTSQAPELPLKDARKPPCHAPNERCEKVRPQIPERKASLAHRTGHRNGRSGTPVLVKNASKSLPIMTANKGAGFRRIDYGRPTPYTALNSHTPSKKELKYASWLSEGWQVWSASNRPHAPVVMRVQDEYRSKSKAGLRGWFARK